MNNNNDLYKRLDLVNNWINNLDLKITFLLTFVGAVVIYFLSNIDIISNLQKINLCKLEELSFYTGISLVLILTIFIILIKCIYDIFEAMKAKINIDEYKTSGLKIDSLLHFGTIATYSFKEFSKKLNKSNKSKIISNGNAIERN